METNLIPAPQPFLALATRPPKPDRGKPHASRWLVVLDGHDDSGNKVLSMPMAPQRRRRAQAEGDLRQIRGLYPAAYLVQWRFEEAAFDAGDA